MLILVAILVFIITNILFLLLFGRTEEFKYLYSLVKQKLTLIIRKKKGESTQNVRIG